MEQLPGMDTPAHDWPLPAARITYPGWVQRKAVKLCKRDQWTG
jgi:hypothetical protein